MVISVIVGGFWVEWGGVCGGFIISEVIEVYLFYINDSSTHPLAIYIYRLDVYIRI